MMVKKNPNISFCKKKQNISNYEKKKSEYFFIIDRLISEITNRTKV
jgi:hypothetical protein